MKRLVILISGRGSNMRSLIEARLAGAQIVAVISNRPQAAGLAYASSQGIPTAVVVLGVPVGTTTAGVRV
jgi:phosphoribosylglycinamide formyltransferase-1